MSCGPIAVNGSRHTKCRRAWSSEKNFRRRWSEKCCGACWPRNLDRRADLNSHVDECLANTRGKPSGTWCVAVHADRLDIQRHSSAIRGHHHTLARNRHCPVDDLLRIVDDGTRLTPWHQRAVRAIRAVGERLADGAHAVASCRIEGLGTRQAEQ